MYNCCPSSKLSISFSMTCKNSRSVPIANCHLHLHLSLSFSVAHKASIGRLHISLSAVAARTSSKNCQPASFLSFNCTSSVGIWPSSSSSFFWCQSHCHAAVVVVILSQYVASQLPSSLLHFLTRWPVSSFQ